LTLILAVGYYLDSHKAHPSIPKVQGQLVSTEEAQKLASGSLTKNEALLSLI
jgi:hypothetical protein